MSRPHWMDEYEQEESETETLLSKRWQEDVPLMAWSHSRIDEYGLKHARPGEMAYAGAGGWWATMPVFWRLTLIVVLLAVVVGFVIFMINLGNGRIAHAIFRPHSDLNLVDPKDLPPDKVENPYADPSRENADSGAGGGAAGTTGGGSDATGGSTVSGGS